MIKKYWPLIISLVLFWIVLTIVFSSIAKDNGNIVYTLDDPYIHMAMAKNFSEHGVWGVTSYEFSSASSAPLWTLLLSLVYSVFGVSDLTPYILNVLFGILLLFTAYFIMAKYSIKPLFILIALALIIFSMPLVPLIFSGQEHVMQVLIDLLFVYFGALALSSQILTPKKLIPLLLLAASASFARYEGLFLVFAVAIVFILQRRWRDAGLIGLAGLLPIFIYGMISLAQGWFFLPSSIVLKGYLPQVMDLNNIFQFFERRGHHIFSEHSITFLLIGSLIISLARFRKDNGLKEPEFINIIFVITAAFHILFGSFGWFFRYEAYLIPLGIVAITLGINTFLDTKKEPLAGTTAESPIPDNTGIIKYAILVILLLVFLFPFFTRARNSLAVTPSATSNIHLQQYQMGLFLKKFYQGKTVAANDVGAINYLADIRCIDLYGIGTFQVANMQKMGKYNSYNLNTLVKMMNTSIAVVYDSWLIRAGGIPPEWIKCGEWKVRNRTVSAEDTVAFYAIIPAEYPALIRNLRAFSQELPQDIIQQGKYTEIK
jgi:hypothetical protein